jgi:hypothetical protein
MIDGRTAQILSLRMGQKLEAGHQVWTFDETTVPEGPFHSNQHPYRYFFRIEISILNP